MRIDSFERARLQHINNHIKDRINDYFNDHINNPLLVMSSHLPLSVA
jgi:hypothetical protein